jgi:hypothetical protein
MSNKNFWKSMSAEAGETMKQSWGNLANPHDVKNEATSAREAENAKVAEKRRAEEQEVKEENDKMLEGFKVPDLSRRMDINKNFPVIVQTLRPYGDRIERFGLEWNRKEFHSFFDSCGDEDVRADFVYYTVWRLIYSLRKRSELYTIEPPLSSSQICIIAMTVAPETERVIRSTKMFMLSRGVHIPPTPPDTRPAHEVNFVPAKSYLSQEAYENEMYATGKGPKPEREGKTATASTATALGLSSQPKAETRTETSAAPAPPPAPPAKAAAPPAPAAKVAAHHAAPHHAAKATDPSYSGPRLHSLNDIKAHFPVVWSHDRSRNLYLLDIFGKKVREDAERRLGHPLDPRGPEVAQAMRDVQRDLHRALLASDAWDYYEPRAANSGHFAVLSMRSGHRGSTSISSNGIPTVCPRSRIAAL